MNNPFEAEFDSSEVVNKKNQESEPVDPLFSESDLEEFFRVNPSDLLKGVLEEEEEPHKSLYKKEELENSDVEVYSVSEALGESEGAKEFSFNFGVESETGKEAGEFRDFVELPNITGSAKNPLGKNIIGAEEIDAARKIVEIADKFELEEVSHQQASVVINRDMTGEIESVEIYCKCGERTFIKFDYEDEDSASERTEVVRDSPSGLK
ncbi:MAG: hypothetical protein ACM3U1_01080 [Chloroflexota bacterium]